MSRCVGAVRMPRLPIHRLENLVFQMCNATSIWGGVIRLLDHKDLPLPANVTLVFHRVPNGQQDQPAAYKDCLVKC